MATISIRPNLNTGARFGSAPQITIHKGALGEKLDSVERVTIACSGVIVRKGGQRLAELKGDKTVHAGFKGSLVSFVEPPESALRVVYNPHLGHDRFYVESANGELSEYVGGGLITMIGWKAWLVG